MIIIVPGKLPEDARLKADILPAQGTIILKVALENLRLQPVTKLDVRTCIFWQTC